MFNCMFNGDEEGEDMAKCEYCGDLIPDVEGALYDGTHWFCTYSCRGQWAAQNPGNVPA